MRQRILVALVFTAIGVGGVSLSACGQKKKTVTSAPSASAQPPGLPANVDAELLKQLTDISHACKVDVVEGNVTCPQGENRRLISEFVANQRSRITAVATLAHALADSSPALQVATANLLNGAFRSPWGPDLKAGAVPALEAKALLAAALKAPKALARQAVPAAVLAATLAGQTDELFAALDRSDQTELRPLGYRYVMTHGRLGVFGKVQQLVKDNNSALSFAALEAPHNMYGWTQTEKAAICPWATDLLKDPRPNVATRAAGLLSSCGGEFVDALLERGEKALKGGQFNAGELGAFRDLCSAANLREAGGATEKQCERNRGLLNDVVEAKKLDSQTRSMALASLAYQWPDDKTLKLAQSLLKDSDKSLAEHADRTVKRLEQRKQLEGGSAATDKKTAGKGAKAPGAH
jgi:hypothetical protein